jgi:cytochrome c biogenesis protein CcdA
VKWLRDVAVYSAAGALTSALVGALLGLAGVLILPDRFWAPALPFTGVVAIAAGARELGWISVRFPQTRRQTRDIWAKRYRPPVAPALWGLDLGLVFTSWFTFSGAWFLVSVTFVSASVAYGAALMIAYWLGRAASVWLAPLMMSDARATPLLLAEIDTEFRSLRLTHVLGLALGIATLALVFAQTQ